MLYVDRIPNTFTAFGQTQVKCYVCRDITYDHKAVKLDDNYICFGCADRVIKEREASDD